MNSVIRLLFSLIICSACVTAAVAAQDLRQRVLRDAALEAGLTPPDAVNAPFDPEKAAIGEALFASDTLSLNSDMSCRTCHLPQFSSGDGLPNAVGTGGIGEGPARLATEGEIVPRNALPLWGRGGIGFDTFFWDGKVRRDTETGAIISQFGMAPPADDPLLTSVHLPFVEIDEMVDETQNVSDLYKTESVASAETIFEELAGRVRSDENLAVPLAAAFSMDPSELSFDQVADAVAHFIRREFRIRETDFHKFVFSGDSFTNEQLRGGLLFYGKGGCVACHNGPFFTDFEFHAIPFPQAGFGKNGFGLDYGRYNVTFDPRDLYKFRTPPLYNVEHSAPYSHSGSVATLEDAIRAHIDPLALDAFRHHNPIERQEYYRRLKAWASEPMSPAALTEDDITSITVFLNSLTYCEPGRTAYCQE
ncbi:methylamine utilization protein MauG [Parvularcula flava]|uniref:Methylamine utilization protein MauG n=1 Tax=Aquisalinus luteolus TaxID=1566827 RepID=A0A8J3A6B5_9PROT|nr:His-Xaa-Ser system-associated MauG-like protein [Aquisalinus luteolus]NHK27156.1 methylamine utilization protein MauG [Aquisalinus luteolus]GGH94569.1 methylamine utilization protein MauG [Aquisalinus luteolus]